MIQSRVKSCEVNYMQRIQGSMHVPSNCIRGEGRMLIRITTRDSNQSINPSINDTPILHPSKQLMYDVRPFFDYTFNEVAGFTYVGCEYWNGTVKSGDTASIHCLLSSDCCRVEFTGSIVRPDASYNKRQNFWNSVTLYIDWFPQHSTTSACSWSETMRGHRRVGNSSSLLEGSEMLLPNTSTSHQSERKRKKLKQTTDDIT